MSEAMRKIVWRFIWRRMAERACAERLQMNVVMMTDERRGPQARRDSTMGAGAGPWPSQVDTIRRR